MFCKLPYEWKSKIVDLWTVSMQEFKNNQVNKNYSRSNSYHSWLLYLFLNHFPKIYFFPNTFYTWEDHRQPILGENDNSKDFLEWNNYTHRWLIFFLQVIQLPSLLFHSNIFLLLNYKGSAAFLQYWYALISPSFQCFTDWQMYQL